MQSKRLTSVKTPYVANSFGAVAAVKVADIQTPKIYFASFPSNFSATKLNSK